MHTVRPGMMTPPPPLQTAWPLNAHFLRLPLAVAISSFVLFLSRQYMLEICFISRHNFCAQPSCPVLVRVLENKTAIAWSYSFNDADDGGCGKCVLHWPAPDVLFPECILYDGANVFSFMQKKYFVPFSKYILYDTVTRQDGCSCSTVSFRWIGRMGWISGRGEVWSTLIRR